MARSIAALLLALLITASPGSAQQAEQELDDVLWFTYNEDATAPRNFTTYPPTPADPTRTAETRTFLSRSQIEWQTIVPADWTVQPDLRISVEVHIEGLGRVVPIADPTTEPDANGKIRVRGDLLWRDLSGAPVATGYTDLDPRPLDDSVEKIRLDLVVAEGRTLPARGGALSLTLIVTGYTRQEFPLVVHFGSEERPSHIRIEGFPFAAYRALEEAERRHKECLARVLQKMECEPIHAPAEEGPSKETPASMGAVFATTLFVFVSFIRRQASR